MNNCGLFHVFLLQCLICILSPAIVCMDTRGAPPKRSYEKGAFSDSVIGRMIQELLSGPPKRSSEGITDDGVQPQQDNAVDTDKPAMGPRESYVSPRPKSARQFHETLRSWANMLYSKSVPQTLMSVERGTPKIAKEMDGYETRESREDHVVNVNSSDITLPWEDECSKGYQWCDGYFPACCERFVCYKPLTDWDKRHNQKRCWPSYFVVGDEG